MATPKPDRHSKTPFLLKLFYKSNDFHRLDDFTPTRQPTSYLQIYTWPSCSLKEMTTLLTTTLPSLFEPTAAGHRVAFHLIFPDMRTPPRTPDAPGRYTAKDMGSVIIGADSAIENGARNAGTNTHVEDDSAQTLQDFKFVTGDWVSCAILPPLENGDVAPPPPSVGPTRAGYGAPLPRSFGGDRGPMDNGYFGGRGGRVGGYGGSGRDSALPSGEWRRGERLPEGPSFRGGGGGYGRGRGRW